MNKASKFITEAMPLAKLAASLESLPGDIKSALTRAGIVTSSNYATTKIVDDVKIVGDIVVVSLSITELNKPELLSLAKSRSFKSILHTSEGLKLKFKR